MRRGDFVPDAVNFAGRAGNSRPRFVYRVTGKIIG